MFKNKTPLSEINLASLSVTGLCGAGRILTSRIYEVPFYRYIFVDFFQLAEQAEKEKEAEDDEEEEEDEEEEDEEKAEAGKPKSDQGRGKHIRDRLKFFFCIKKMGPKKRIGKSR